MTTVTTCHIDRKHYAKGLCSACYRKNRRKPHDISTTYVTNPSAHDELKQRVAGLEMWVSDLVNRLESLENQANPPAEPWVTTLYRGTPLGSDIQFYGQPGTADGNPFAHKTTSENK